MHAGQNKMANDEFRLRIWDLPTRLFHWALSCCVLASIVTAKIGGNAVVWHFRFGYCALALLGFRLIWGFAGGRYARFSSFWFAPARVVAYLRGRAPAGLGHNPIGALSVYALLLAIGFQAGSGLFANDDIASEGPLAKWISKAWSDRLTGLHHSNQYLIIGLVLLHIGAIVFYLRVRKQNLITAMITGDQSTDAEPPSGVASRDDAALRWRALAALALSVGAVYAIVNWPKSAF